MLIFIGFDKIFVTNFSMLCEAEAQLMHRLLPRPLGPVVRLTPLRFQE